MNNEPIIDMSLLEYDDSEIKAGDIVYIAPLDKSRIDTKSRNHIVEVNNILQNTWVEFLSKHNNFSYANINGVKKVKTYSCSEVNHKSGDLFFSLEEVTGVREKNIVYEEILIKNNLINQNKVFYKSIDGYSSSINRLKTLVFINVNNNLDIIGDEYKKNNPYLNIVKSMQKKQGLAYG